MFCHLFDPTVLANEEKHSLKSTCKKEPQCIRLKLCRSLDLSTQDLLPGFEHLLSGEGSFFKQEVSQLPKTSPPEGNTCVRGLGKAVLAHHQLPWQTYILFVYLWVGSMPVTHLSLLKVPWWWQVGCSPVKKPVTTHRCGEDWKPAQFVASWQRYNVTAQEERPQLIWERPTAEIPAEGLPWGCWGKMFPESSSV